MMTMTTPKYDPEMAKLAVVCSQLTYEQFDEGIKNPNYDGSISELPSYSQLPKGFTQVLTLKNKEIDPTCLPEVKAALDQLLKANLLGNNNVVKAIEKYIIHIGVHEFIQKAEESKIGHTESVYFGFLLQSKDKNFLAFRGTKTPMEWVTDLLAFQTDINQHIKVKEPYSDVKVHLGFMLQYQYFLEAINDALKELGGKLPLYVTGHSLGGALSILASFIIGAYNKDTDHSLASEILNYNFGAPRVGNPAFVNNFNRLVPNGQRITNYADIVPLLPPTNLKDLAYDHAGTQLSYLFYKEDIINNHNITSNYTVAVNTGAISQTSLLPNKPISCLC